jgi:hypothetical protein
MALVVLVSPLAWKVCTVENIDAIFVTKRACSFRIQPSGSAGRVVTGCLFSMSFRTHHHHSATGGCQTINGRVKVVLSKFQRVPSRRTAPCPTATPFDKGDEPIRRLISQLSLSAVSIDHGAGLGCAGVRRGRGHLPRQDAMPP